MTPTNQQRADSETDSGVSDVRSSCRLLVLCNQVMKKRCASIETQLRCGGVPLGLESAMKCVTYVEDVNAFSVSQKTEKLLHWADLVLCILRVERAQPKALDELHKFVQSSSKDSIMLLQCIGDSFVVQHADSGGNTRTDEDPTFVNFFLRCWLCERLRQLGRHPPPTVQELKFFSVDNNQQSVQLLRHKLLSRRYTLDVEYQHKRNSMYKRASADARSPVLTKRSRSLENCLDSDELDSGVTIDMEEPLLSNQLILCHSSRTANEAQLCLNQLTSRGCSARSLPEFLAGGQRSSLMTLRCRFQKHRRLLARAFASEHAASASFLLFCYDESSKLLRALLAAQRQQQHLMCIVVFIAPTVQPPQLQATSQLEVFYSNEGLQGHRVLHAFMPSLVRLVRQMERQWAVRDDNVTIA